MYSFSNMCDHARTSIQRLACKEIVITEHDTQDTVLWLKDILDCMYTAA